MNGLKDFDLVKVNCVIIGGGAVGLAIGAELSRRKDFTCVVLEAESSYGQGISSRNSEVVHAGIYYPKDSLKANLCVRGKELLYDFCQSRAIPYNQCGKIIVATNEEEIGHLEKLNDAAVRNGVEDLEQLSRKQIQIMEPFVEASAGLFSPSTGIVDSHQLMTSLLGKFEVNGGIFAPNSEVLRVARVGCEYNIAVDNVKRNDGFVVETPVLINAAGLSAQRIAEKIDDFPVEVIPKLHLCKGVYFKMTGHPPFQHLIYPVPPKRGDGLGIHATIDMQGGVKFGPDVEYIEDLDFSIDASKRKLFFEAIQRYFPHIDIKRLTPDYSGIRPKLQGPNDAFKDFVIMDCDIHGFPGLIQLFGIESPGLTSSMAIAEYVDRLI